MPINFNGLMNKYGIQWVIDDPSANNRGLLLAFGKKVNVSDRYLSHVKCKRKVIGPRIARKIEHAFILPVGWMDVGQGGPIVADSP